MFKLKKRREDSFFGMHFDFHATEQLKNIGADANIEQLGRFLDLVKPDFIECDTIPIIKKTSLD